MFDNISSCEMSDMTIDIGSTWSDTKQMSEAGAQTHEIITSNAETSTSDTAEADTQTNPDDFVKEPIDDEEENNILDLVDLGECLVKAAERIEPCLENNLKSHAFDGYETRWEEDVGKVACLHTLRHSSIPSGMQCTSVSWNCTGSVLYAAYGHYDHETWSSYICTWNVDRRSVNPEKADCIVEMPSGVNAIACHPAQPSIVVCGTFHGKVMLLDTGRTSGQELISMSESSKISHSEPILDVKWMVDYDMRKKPIYSIFSVAGDGRVLQWRIPPKTGIKGITCLTLVSRLLVNASDLRRSQRLAKGTRVSKNTEVGLTCISFSGEDKDRFVVGTETGALLGCSLQHAPSIAGDADVAEASPVVMGYTPHAGPVYSVAFSPFHRNLFLSASTDGSVQLYSLLEAKPLHSVSPSSGYLFDVAWSPLRPMVCAVATGTGSVLFYDFAKNRASPCLELEANTDAQPVYSVAFNPKNRRLIASGDANGQVKVWTLSHDLTERVPDEIRLLTDIAELP